MEERSLKRIGFVVLLVLLVLGWLTLFFVSSPEEVVEWLGVTNGYLVVFLLGVIGAVTSLTSVSTYPAIYTLAAGEMNPGLLVVISGVGLTLGDFLFILLGISARGVLSEGTKERVARFLAWLYQRPTVVIQFFLFVWVGLTPFANNLLTAPLAVTEFPARKMVVPIFLGNLVLPVLTVWLGMKGVAWLW